MWSDWAGKYKHTTNAPAVLLLRQQTECVIPTEA